MTLFFADVRIYRLPDHHYYTLSVEVVAPDMTSAFAVLQAWNAGLAVHPAFDSGFEEALYSNRRRGAEYFTLKEAALRVRKLFEER